ncbi:MAG: DivIVA domain-containing protein [Acidimicrobiia bacterium]|nr:DivIVA domain-containing protein [Acidimicrobiia bacterium]MBT8192963.1 DivIVA domain-containing protein [Acidimicrobiia bacterium]MBT8247787.1 DivIVA domain-containing protein [Acidimicrobiia bacterium]NNF89637.1 DivIVA domain-containing protein [Acidimicrobiia bacterium]NNL14004.1 DivIVA domain-containing protein [Acidimicrobiia bacterium]
MDLSAIDVQQKTFRERFRGYDPDDVEDFLDRVVETLRGYELKARQQQEQLDALAQDLAGTKEAEEAIKRTYITAQRTSQEMVSEAQEKSNAILDKAKGQSESMVGEARAEVKRTREEAVAEHDALKRRIAQLRSAVGDMQSRLKEFAETASIDLEGLGASIDLETHSISEILENAAAESDEAPGDEATGVVEADQPAEVVAEENADEGAEAAAEDAREAAYLQQPRGQRPWERA